MQTNLKKLIGYKVYTLDGAQGKVSDFYFDDVLWIIRYLIVDTGKWLSNRKVLISPVAIGKSKPEISGFSVNLTSKQVHRSPNIDLRKPVSRQQELKVLQHYGWPVYWPGETVHFVAAHSTATTKAADEQDEARTSAEHLQHSDFHLRSAREVMGYHIQAKDNQTGHIDDIIAKDENWRIQKIVIDTRNWLPGKKVLMELDWIRKISWAESKVYVDLTTEEINLQPELDTL